MDYPGKVIRKTPVTPTQASASGVWTVDDALQAVKTNTWPIAGVPNPISRSLRFNSADSAYLNRTPASAGNRKTWTLSCWVKRSNIGVFSPIFTAATIAPRSNINFRSDDAIEFRQLTSSETDSTKLITTQVFRDVGAWYHLVFVQDTTQATSSNRAKMYVNGVQVTAFSTATYPSQDFETLGINNNVVHEIGRYASSTGDGSFPGYMTEINFIDGQALTPSDFGLTDPQTGQWVPKKYTGTYGTNGFYVNFSDNSSTGTLGYDYSGNSNNWTSNNFSVTAGAGNDSLVDVPTPWIAYNTTGDVGGVFRGNYCTLNPLNNPGGSTFANGNLDVTTASSTGGRVVGTVGVSSGKWYWEITPTSVAGQSLIGIAAASRVSSGGVGDFSDDYAYQNNGNKYSNSVGASYGASYVANDVIGVALDLDAGTLVFYKNNSSQGTAYSSISGTFVPAMSDGQNANSSAFVCNFGQRPFAYAPPAGFLSLCTTNLPTPTIGATSATQAGKYLNTVLYTGNGSTQSITGVGFQPDFTWIKSRSGVGDNNLTDAVRGATITLFSNDPSRELTLANGLTSFNSDGFSVGNNSGFNTNTTTYVAWNWKANGSGSSNTAGSISSTVSVNTTAGFSVVTYTGNATAGATIGHGLGATPSMIIVKDRVATSGAREWVVYHSSLGNTQAVFLNTTGTAYTGTNLWNNTSPTSTVFTVGNSSEGTNGSGNAMVAYCFASIAGYSAFGKYTGNDVVDGPMVFTGFRPRYVLIKSSTVATNWYVLDSSRSPYNESKTFLYPSLSIAEDVLAYGVDFLSNGFKVRAPGGYGTNNSGATYIYAAFAEFPFKFSNAR